VFGVTQSFVDKDCQTQRMGQYVEIYERFPTCSLVKVHESNPLQQIMMQLLTQKKRIIMEQKGMPIVRKVQFFVYLLFL